METFIVYTNLDAWYKHIVSLSNRGELEHVENYIARILDLSNRQVDDETIKRFLPFRVWTNSRRGKGDAALQAIMKNSKYQEYPNTVLDIVSALRYRGFTPIHTPIWRWIARGEELLKDHFNEANRTQLLMHKGHAFMKATQYEEAILTIHKSLEFNLETPKFQQLRALSMCDLANCYRILGEEDKAHEMLNSATSLLSRPTNKWELYDSRIYDAFKLGGVSAPSAEELNRANILMRFRGNFYAALRFILFDTRGNEEIPVKASYRCVKSYRNFVPDFHTCPLYKRILDNWNAWTAGEQLDGVADYYWGV